MKCQKYKPFLLCFVINHSKTLIIQSLHKPTLWIFSHKSVLNLVSTLKIVSNATLTATRHMLRPKVLDCDCCGNTTMLDINHYLAFSTCIWPLFLLYRRVFLLIYSWKESFCSSGYSTVFGFRSRPSPVKLGYVGLYCIWFIVPGKLVD